MFAALLGLGELYLRVTPFPQMLQFMTGRIDRDGIYRPDAVYAINYRDEEAFRSENPDRLARFEPYFHGSAQKPLWAFFGNSFVQAPGMLADVVRANDTRHEVFNLGRNTPLPIRFAQVELLLEMGLEPERILFSFMPVDTLNIGRFPLETHRVTESGALGYEPRLPPGPLGDAIRESRLLLAMWIRANRHQQNRGFSLRDAHEGIDERLLRDVRHLFASLREVSLRAKVPVTVLLIPDRRQIVEGASFGFQDTLAPILRENGFDVFDPRAALLAHDRPGTLFIPDGHYADSGNAIIFDALMRHLDGGAGVTGS